MSLAHVEDSPDFDDATSISDNDEVEVEQSSQKKVLKVPGKMVLIGQGAVGKTCFLIRAAHNEFPEEYVPTVFDSPDQPVSVRSNKHRVDVQIGLFDTVSRSDYEKLRRLSYPGADLMVVCFSVIDHISFENAMTYFFAEAIEHAPGVPVVLLGLKSDLRTSPEVVEMLKKRDMRMVARSEAEAVARKLGIRYFEASSKTNPEGVQHIMQQFANIIADRRVRKDGKKSSGNGLVGLVKRLFGGRQE